MMKLGSWEVNVVVGAMPQKVATAFGEIFANLYGAEYTPIAYLGKQVVNGVNHAILAEQRIITGHDVKNIVMIVLNEKPEGFSLVSITPEVEGSTGVGAVEVDVKTDIPADAKAAFEASMVGFVGCNVEPFVLLATQVTKGTDYIFAAESEVVAPDATKRVVLVTSNIMTRSVQFETILG